MLECVVFDMDGVIIDSEPAYLEVETKVLEGLGISVPAEYHQRFVGATAPHMWREVIRDYSLSESVEDLVRMERAGYMSYLRSEKHLRSIPGASRLIRELNGKGVKLVVASSSPARAVDEVLGRLKLSRFFRGAVGGDEVQKGKPAPDIFLVAAKLAGSTADRCLAIEDSRNGVKSAKSAGMRCVGFKNPNSGNQDLSLADLVVERISELTYETLAALF